MYHIAKVSMQPIYPDLIQNPTFSCLFDERKSAQDLQKCREAKGNCIS